MADRKVRPTEADVTKTVLAYWAAHGITVHRRNVGGFWYLGSRIGRKKFHPAAKFVRFGDPGACDYWFLWSRRDRPAIHVEMEIKRPGERPEPHQVEWMIRINADGGFAFWCDDLERAISAHQAIQLNQVVFMHPDGDFYFTHPAYAGKG